MSWIVSASIFPSISAMEPPARSDLAYICLVCKPRDSPIMVQVAQRVYVRDAMVKL